MRENNQLFISNNKMKESNVFIGDYRIYSCIARFFYDQFYTQKVEGRNIHK